MTRTPAAIRRHRAAQRHRKNAAALPLVLVTLALLAVIVGEIISAATVRLEWEGQRSQHDDLRREAISALESTLAVLGAFSRIDGALYGPAQGWSDPLAMAAHTAPEDVEVSVTLRDETGYFSLPELIADTFLLRRYFQDLGIGESQAQSLADCLADWTDVGDTPRLNGAERESYTDGVAPPNRPLQSFDELRLVQGFAEVFYDEDGELNDLGRRFFDSVTLLGGSARPNINTAPSAVLEILAERYGIDTDNLLQARETQGNSNGTGTVFRNAADLGRASFPVAMGDAVSFNCVRLRVIARASRGDTTVVVDTLLDSTGSGNATGTQYPFTILQQRVNSYLQE